MNILTASDIRKSFSGVRALKGVSFAVDAGEVHALVGENGAGKSTLIKIMTGALPADSGSLHMDGTPVALDRFTPADARALGIVAIYQQPALFPDLSVAENIAMAIEPARMWPPIDWRRWRTNAAACLDRIGADIDPDRPVGSLSMPEQQLVEIAKALGSHARVVLMDEPTASLTTREVDRLFDVIASLRTHGVGVLYISHRLEELFMVADRITVLRDGQTVHTDSRAVLTRDRLVHLMAGRELSSSFPERIASAGDIALEVQRLTSASAGVRDISLHVRRGEILGIAGLVGSGRTELAEALFGLRHIDDGRILVHGAPVEVRSPADAQRAGLAYVPEDRRHHGVIGEMSLVANASMAVLPTVSRAGFIVADREAAIARRYVSDFQIKTAGIHAPVSTLSGGNQQKVSLARWLAANPTVLILDEPTQGVDVGAKAEIHGVMRRLVEQGLAVVMISSDLPEIIGMSDRIAVMRHGAIVGTVSREDATAETVLALALGHTTQDAHEATPT